MRKIIKEGVDYGKIAEKAVAIIKGKGHIVVLFTADGMETSDPEEARRLYVKDPNYMVTIDEGASVIRINKNQQVPLEQIEAVLKQVKNLARNYMLKSELQVFGKEIAPKDFAFQAKKLRDSKMSEARRLAKGDWKTYTGTHAKSGKEKTWHSSVADHKKGDVIAHGGHKYKITKVEDMKQVSEASLSRMSGSKKTSYQTLESTKIIVRHRKPVDEDVRGSRSRQIKAIFIERAGERFKFPHNNLAGARAMARHIDEGGAIHDDVGKYIVESVGNMLKLVEFMRYTRTNKLINENSEDIVKTVRENITAYRNELKKFQGVKSYAKMCEQIANREGSEIEEDTGDLQDMFTVRKFDEKITDTLPLIKKLVTEKNAWRSMIEEASEAQFVVTSSEELIEGDAIEFDSPTQKLGYKIRTLSERVVEEGELSKFVHKIGNKLIEGSELSKFEKSVMRNVLENIVVAEEAVAEEDGLIDKLDEVMNDFERKMKLVEFDLDWDEDNEEALYKDFYGDDEDELAGMSVRSRRRDSNIGDEDDSDLFGVSDTSCPDCLYSSNPNCERCGGQGEVFESDYEPLTKRDCPECGDFSMDLVANYGDEFEYLCNTCGHEMSDSLSRVQIGHDPAPEDELEEGGDVVSGPCRWWAMCDNDATTTELHPILGDVPICDRCEAKLRKIEGMERKPELSEEPGDWDHGYNYEGPSSPPVGMTRDDAWNAEVARGEAEAGAGMGYPMDDDEIEEGVFDGIAKAAGRGLGKLAGAAGKAIINKATAKLIKRAKEDGNPVGIAAQYSGDEGFLSMLEAWLKLNQNHEDYALVAKMYGIAGGEHFTVPVDEDIARMKSLAGIEENVDPEDFMDECPACEGTGKEYGEGGGGDCEKCDGNGYV